MIKLKTHFEQVPIELVKEIIGKQAEADAGGLTPIKIEVPALTGKPKVVKGKF
jgi:hypothetical protein